MSSRGEEYGMTCLRPNEEGDLIIVDHALIKAVLDQESGKRRTTALAYLAIFVRYELARLLKFRFVTEWPSETMAKPLKHHPGLPARRLGPLGERNAFGSSIFTVLPSSDLMSKESFAESCTPTKHR